MAGSDAKATSDEELACRAQVGCTASFEELVRRFQVPLLHFLRRLGAGPDAEDLLQETFLRAYRNLGQYEPGGGFAPWLFTIARRLRINLWRRAGLSVESESAEAASSPEACPSDELAQAEDRQRLWKAASRILSSEEMTAVWLFYVEEMSAKEIARVLDRSWVSVKTMLFRARRRLLPVFEELERSDTRSPRQVEFNRQSNSRGVGANHV